MMNGPRRRSPTTTTTTTTTPTTTTTEAPLSFLADVTPRWEGENQSIDHYRLSTSDRPISRCGRTFSLIISAFSLTRQVNKRRAQVTNKKRSGGGGQKR